MDQEAHSYLIFETAAGCCGIAWNSVGVTRFQLPTGANALKVPSGGWFPLVVGLVVFTILSTWRAGRRSVRMLLESEAMPLASFLATCEQAPEARVSGTAVFLTTQTRDVPVALLHNLKHNKVLHRYCWFASSPRTYREW
jgi:K+ transporter